MTRGLRQWLAFAVMSAGLGFALPATAGHDRHDDDCGDRHAHGHAYGHDRHQAHDGGHGYYYKPYGHHGAPYYAPHYIAKRHHALRHRLYGRYHGYHGYGRY